MTNIIFLMMVLAIAIIPTSGLFPMGHLTVQKAKDIQSGSFLARSVINQYRCTWPSSLFQTPVDANTAVPPVVVPAINQTLDGTDYTVLQTLTDVQNRTVTTPGSSATVEICMIDVEVDVTSPEPAATDQVRNASVRRDIQEMQKL